MYASSTQMTFLCTHNIYILVYITDLIALHNILHTYQIYKYIWDLVNIGKSALKDPKTQLIQYIYNTTPM